MIWIAIGCIPIVLLLILYFMLVAADLGIRSAIGAFAFTAVVVAIVVGASLSIGYGIEQL